MGKNRNRSQKERLTERDAMPFEKKLEKSFKYKQLKLVDVKCKDCAKEFQWYLGTIRCAVCNRAFRQRHYVKKNNHSVTPMVIFNSKGLIIGEADRPSEIKKWFLENTKIKEEKLNKLNAVRTAINTFTITKFICYWICYKKDYSLENAIAHINKRSKLFGVKRDIKRSQELIDKVMSVFNDTGLHKEIASRHNLTRSAVNHIKTGHSYSDITGKVYKQRYNLSDYE